MLIYVITVKKAKKDGSFGNKSHNIDEDYNNMTDGMETNEHNHLHQAQHNSHLQVQLNNHHLAHLSNNLHLKILLIWSFSPTV